MTLHSLPEMDYVIYDEKQIDNLVEAVALSIKDFYDLNSETKPENLVVITALKGAAPFAEKLAPKLKELGFGIFRDTIRIKSYQGSESSGHVQILKDLNQDISGKDVLLVEDILDTGITLKFLIGNLLLRNPKSLSVAVLLDKPLRRRYDVESIYPDVRVFKGISIDDLFVVGFGLDYNERYRELPYIGVLKKEVYQ